MVNLMALVSGLLFGIGLIIAGMADPGKVLGFLDIAGAWDPSLAFVMGGAIGVMLPVSLWAKRMGVSLLGGVLNLPVSQLIDRRLLTGSALFGIGWGIAGVCPGPAFVLLGQGQEQAVVFVLAMLAGMVLFTLFSKKS